MPKKCDTRYRDCFLSRVPKEIASRLTPLIAQRKKDANHVYLHTIDHMVPPSAISLICEAVEFYCDLYQPIDSTPKKLLANTEVPVTIKTCPHTGWYEPDKMLRIYWKSLNRTTAILRKKIEMHHKLMRKIGKCRNQEVPYERESDEWTKADYGGYRGYGMPLEDDVKDD